MADAADASAARDDEEGTPPEHEAQSAIGAEPDPEPEPRLGVEQGKPAEAPDDKAVAQSAVGSVDPEPEPEPEPEPQSAELPEAEVSEDGTVRPYGKGTGISARPAALRRARDRALRRAAQPRYEHERPLQDAHPAGDRAARLGLRAGVHPARRRGQRLLGQRLVQALLRQGVDGSAEAELAADRDDVDVPAAGG